MSGGYAPILIENHDFRLFQAHAHKQYISEQLVVL